jgi:fibronectin-binding autotransporter adhesin
MPNFPLTSRPVLAALALLPLLSPTLSAADLYWGGWDGVVTTNTWSTAGNWFTDAGETTAGTVPLSTSDLIFNTTPDAARGGTINLSGNVVANSMTFRTTGTTTISQNSVNRTLTLGTGGITMDAGAATVNIGASTASLSVELTGSQTWTNNSTNALNVRSPRVSNSAAGATTLTLNAASTGGIALALGFKDSPDAAKALTVIVDSAGTGVVSTINASTHTGGTQIKRGIVQTRTDFGTGAIIMGNTAGATSSTLRIELTTAVNNTLETLSGSLGTQTLEFINSTSGTYGGQLTLNANLNVGVRNSTSGSTLSGAINGSGDLIKGQYQGSNTTGLLTYTGAATHTGDVTINNGAFTLGQTGSLTFYLGANGVTNQLNGSTTGAVIIDGTFNLNTAGASLVDGNVWNLVNLTNETYGDTFALAGFTQNNNIWTNGVGFTFEEATGNLTYMVPEPSALTALLLGLTAVTIRRRRR